MSVVAYFVRRMDVDPFERRGRRRHSLRLQSYDYVRAGAYFVTICTQGRVCFLGRVIDGEVLLNDAGRMVANELQQLPARFPHLRLDLFVVMPDHVHAILVLTESPTRRGESCIRPREEAALLRSGDHKDRPYARSVQRGTQPGSLGRIVQAFKSITTHRYTRGVRHHAWPPFSRRLWQRNYYDHVIRNDTDLAEARRYIENNPLRWAPVSGR